MVSPFIGAVTRAPGLSLIMFGAGKLPEIGEGLGRGIRNFRKSVKAPDEIDVTPQDEKEAESDREGAPPKQS